MPRFVNRNIKNYYSSSVQGFSDGSRNASSGVTRGNQSIRYSWLADLLHKNSGNNLLNPHAAHISFFSDREIAIQEYGNVQDIYDSYVFLQDHERQQYSDASYELSTRQYSLVGQRDAETDTISFVNASFQIVGCPQYFIDEEIGDISKMHEFFRAPLYHAEGYRVDQGSGYEKYYFVNTNSHISRIFEYSFTLTLMLNTSLIFDDIRAYAPDYNAVYGAWVGNTLVERIIDWKLDVDNPRVKYIPEALDNWVFYYNDTEKYAGQKYYPYIGAVNVYDKDFIQYHGSESIILYPDVVYKGRREPAKVCAVPWGIDKGVISFNPGNHLNDPSDQSRLVFNICSNLLRGSTSSVKIMGTSYGSTAERTTGIDLETERNRRYSAVVATEPYFVTEPIADGEIVKYMFVDHTWSPITNYGSETDFVGYRMMFLKIKAPLSYIKELDRTLSLVEYNSDIIDTLVVEDYYAFLSSLHYDSDTYKLLRINTSSTTSKLRSMLRRQDMCIDDLVDGVAGIGKHYSFVFNPTGPRSDLYELKMKANGAGYRSRTYYDNNGVFKSVEAIAFYCSNYKPTNPPDYNGDIQSVEEISALSNEWIISRIEQSERFKPMIKLPGINGYVKILEKNPHFKMVMANDGLYEVIYNVEFPYCPGSYYERYNMDFAISGYKLTQILYKSSYINAGSWAVYDVGGEKRYDASNDRHAFKGSEHFARVEFLTALEGETTTAPQSDGGHNLTRSDPAKTIHYPEGTVYERKAYSHLSILKPSDPAYSHQGTIQLSSEDIPTTGGGISGYSGRATVDAKLFMLMDNKQWRFDKDRFASYINRENPAHVFSVDVSKLLEDYTQNVAKHASIPDVKRWLYQYLRATSGVSVPNNFQELFDVDEISGETARMTSRYGPIFKDQFKDCEVVFHADKNGLSPCHAFVESNTASESAGDDFSITLKTGFTPDELSEYAVNEELTGSTAIAQFIPSQFHNVDGSLNVQSSESSSELIFEVWDNDSYFGSATNRGNWRPLVPATYDKDKVPGKVALSGLYIDSDPPVPDSPIELVTGFDDLYRIRCVKWDLVQQNMVTETFESVAGLSNMVLHDSATNENYHIAYIDSMESASSPVRNYVTVYVRLSSSTEPLPELPSAPFEEGSLSICYVNNRMGESPVDVLSEELSSVSESGVITRCIDIRESDSFQRYVDNGKILFRARVVRSRQYPVSHDVDGTDSFQFVGSKVAEGVEPYTFNPWKTGESTFDQALDWTKAVIKDRISKLGCTYFKCASK